MKKPKPFVLPESVFQDQVIDHARLRGWQAYSIPDSRKATARGFPDLTLRHDGFVSGQVRLAFCELKTDNGRIRPEQKEWLTALRTMGEAANASAGYRMVEVFLWRPSFWSDIQAYLDGQDWPNRKAA